jgi:hypothetical protein
MVLLARDKLFSGEQAFYFFCFRLAFIDHVRWCVCGQAPPDLRSGNLGSRSFRRYSQSKIQAGCYSGSLFTLPIDGRCEMIFREEVLGLLQNTIDLARQHLTSSSGSHPIFKMSVGTLCFSVAW